MDEQLLADIHSKLESIERIVHNNNLILVGDGTPEKGVCFKVAMVEDKVKAVEKKVLVIDSKLDKIVPQKNGKTILGLSPEFRDMIFKRVIQIGLGIILGKEALSTFLK